MGQELHTSSSAESSSAGLTCYQIFITEFVQKGEERREKRGRRGRRGRRRGDVRRGEERRGDWDGMVLSATPDVTAALML